MPYPRQDPLFATCDAEQHAISPLNSHTRRLQFPSFKSANIVFADITDASHLDTDVNIVSVGQSLMIDKHPPPDLNHRPSMFAQALKSVNTDLFPSPFFRGRVTQQHGTDHHLGGNQQPISTVTPRERSTSANTATSVHLSSTPALVSHCPSGDVR